MQEKFDFSFGARGKLELGAQTVKNGMAGMRQFWDRANHIHLIVDNGPYFRQLLSNHKI